MNQVDILVSPQPSSRKELIEVLMLSMVDNVEDHIRIPRFDAVFNRGQIRSRVEKRAIAFLDDHRRIETIQENANRAVALASQAALLQ